MGRLVYGVGINDKGEFKSYIKGKPTKEYTIWTGMLERCYSDKFKIDRPTYHECTTSENFKHFQYFADWCNCQIGFGEMNYQLDKDLLVKGNKLYSENNCVFIPRELNYLLLKRQNQRGEFPIGVYKHALVDKYVARRNSSTENSYIGIYDTSIEAFQSYKLQKELEIKRKALEYKHLIDVKAYEALMSYEIEIND